MCFLPQPNMPLREFITEDAKMAFLETLNFGAFPAHIVEDKEFS